MILCLENISGIGEFHETRFIVGVDFFYCRSFGQQRPERCHGFDPVVRLPEFRRKERGVTGKE